MRGFGSRYAAWISSAMPGSLNTPSASSARRRTSTDSDASLKASVRATRTFSAAGGYRDPSSARRVKWARQRAAATRTRSAESRRSITASCSAVRNSSSSHNPSIAVARTAASGSWSARRKTAEKSISTSFSASSTAICRTFRRRLTGSVGQRRSNSASSSRPTPARRATSTAEGVSPPAISLSRTSRITSDPTFLPSQTGHPWRSRSISLTMSSSIVPDRHAIDRGQPASYTGKQPEPASSARKIECTMNLERLHGIIPPILTPLTDEEEVDHASLRRLVTYLLDQGVHGIWVTGTTGEFPCFDQAEREAIVRTVVETVGGRVPVIAGIGDASTRLAIQHGRAAWRAGADAVALTAPYYYVNSQEELLDHFRAVRAAVDLPLMVYNIPQNVKT